MSTFAADEDPVATAPRVGADLSAARLRLGWSLELVAGALRIRLPFLAALEEGRIADLPGNAYAIGFLRTYARTLGLDPDELTRRFRAEAAEVNRLTELTFPAPVPSRGVPAGAVVLLGVVLAIGAYIGWYRLSGNGRLPPEVVPPVPARLAPLAERAVPPDAVTQLSSTHATASTQGSAPRGSAAQGSATQLSGTGGSGIAAPGTGAPGTGASGTGARSAQGSATGAPSAGGASTGPSSLLAASSGVPPSGGSWTPGALSAGSSSSVASSGQAASTAGAAASTAATRAASASGSGPQASPPSPTGGSGNGGARPEPAPFVPPTQAAAATTMPALGAAPAQPAVPQSRIVLSATSDAWMMVRDKSGQVLLNRVLHPGEFWPVPPQPNLLLSVGNAGGPTSWSTA